LSWALLAEANGPSAAATGTYDAANRILTW